MWYPYGLFNSSVLAAVLRIRIRDPVPFWPLDVGSGMGKNQSLETIFLVKMLKYFGADPGSGMAKTRFRDPG